MKISEISKQVGLSVSSIRYYSDLGLIPSMTRDSEGERIFDNEAITWLQGIKFLRELGLTISEIKSYQELCQKSGPAAVKKRHAMLLKQYQKAQAELTDSTERLTLLKAKIKTEEAIIAGKKNDSLSPARRFSQ